MNLKFQTLSENIFEYNFQHLAENEIKYPFPAYLSKGKIYLFKLKQQYFLFRNSLERGLFSLSKLRVK